MLQRMHHLPSVHWCSFLLLAFCFLLILLVIRWRMIIPPFFVHRWCLRRQFSCRCTMGSSPQMDSDAIRQGQRESREGTGRWSRVVYSNDSGECTSICWRMVLTCIAFFIVLFVFIFYLLSLSYRKFTESTISIQNVTSSRAEFEGKRFVFGWGGKGLGGLRDEDAIPELSSRAYMVSLFSEYASVGGAFHDRLSEKYSGQAVGGDPSVDVLDMLVNHPFMTEPNDSVVLADQNKQKIGQSNRQQQRKAEIIAPMAVCSNCSLIFLLLLPCLCCVCCLLCRRFDSDGNRCSCDVQRPIPSDELSGARSDERILFFPLAGRGNSEDCCIGIHYQNRR